MYQISLSLQSSICLCRENEISEPHWFIKQHVTSKSLFSGFLVSGMWKVVVKESVNPEVLR